MTIKSVSNGYVLEFNHGFEAVSDSPHMAVYEYDDIKDHSELEAVQRLLYQVIQELGVYGSKHDVRRLRIVIEENEDYKAASGVEEV